MKNTARRRDVTTNAFAKPRRTASRRCSEALYLFAPPFFNVNYFINPPLAPFAYNNSLYVSLLCPVFCVLHPASGFTPCASRSYLLCPLIIAQRPLCIAPSCRLCICCTFSVITISDILPQSNSESRSHVSCPALRILRPALRPTMALFPVFVSTLPSISCAAPCPFASFVPPLVSSCTMPHSAFTTLFYPAAQQFQALRPVFFAVTASNIIGRKSLRQ